MAVISDPLLAQWEGQFVPRSVEAGFVTLSYLVSLIGSAATLELINRRTAPKGKFNHMLLVSAAVTMGGIAIWCMHFIGNRAVNMAGGEKELQIAYSSGFTALSFFMPILVLLAAFVAIGTSSRVSWWRVAAGGTLAGAAICGMHYLGNASISNYRCSYNYANVVASAVIAVAASSAALSLFFVFRAAWTNSWWKRGASAVVMAGAVSGMHWCAVMGTRYRLVGINNANNETSRNTTVVIVICLCVGACFVIAGTVFYTARVLARYASKAQQVVLAVAIFDQQGRVLVNTDGLLPSEKITDSFLEKNSQDTFGTSHALFQWMFQASRNWSNIGSVVNVMIDHLTRLPHMGRDLSRNGIKLIDERGELIENYDIIFKELFCAAARALAERTKSNLSEIGILWDEILPTGTGGDIRRPTPPQPRKGSSSEASTAASSDGGAAEKGEVQRPAQELYRGSLLFLVRRVESGREITDLEAAGFRFADVRQVSGIISSTMQIKTDNVETKLEDMARYAEEENSRLAPGVHLGFFAVRARVGSQGFDVLVRSATRHLLPSVEMPIDHLDPWQLNLLKQLDGATPAQASRMLEDRKPGSAAEREFAVCLTGSLVKLRRAVGDDIFEDSTFTSRVVSVPCRPGTAAASPATCSLLTFKVVVPIHQQRIRNKDVEFIPLSLFRVHQLVYRDSPHNLIFSRSVHREISPILNAVPAANLYHGPTKSTDTSPPPYQDAIRDRVRRLRSRMRKDTTSPAARDADGNPIPVVFGRRGGEIGMVSNHSSSTLKLWNPGMSVDSGRGGSAAGPDAVDGDGDEHTTPKQSATFGVVERRFSASDRRASDPTRAELSPRLDELGQTHGGIFGGIMVSQEITVNVETGGCGGGDDDRTLRPTGSPESSLEAGGGADVPGERGTNKAIEMQPWRTGMVKAGVTVQAENVASETVTFVDELFALCVEGR